MIPLNFRHVKLLNGAYALFKSSKNNEKRLLLKTLFSNLFLDAEKLVFSRVEVLSKMEKIRFYPKWQLTIDHIRTHDTTVLLQFVSSIHHDLLKAIDEYCVHIDDDTTNTITSPLGDKNSG